MTTRIVSCLVGDPNLNLHLPLLLGGWTTQLIPISNPSFTQKKLLSFAWEFSLSVKILKPRSLKCPKMRLQGSLKLIKLHDPIVLRSYSQLVVMPSLVSQYPARVHEFCWCFVKMSTRFLLFLVEPILFSAIYAPCHSIYNDRRARPTLVFTNGWMLLWNASPPING